MAKMNRLVDIRDRGPLYKITNYELLTHGLQNQVIIALQFSEASDTHGRPSTQSEKVLGIQFLCDPTETIEFFRHLIEGLEEL